MPLGNSFFTRLLSADFGIDLGTSHTLISVPGQGIVLDEPSTVAMRRGARAVLGRAELVGHVADVLTGRTPESVQTVRPVRRGVVADIELCAAMLRAFLGKVRPRVWGLKARVLVAVPGDITPVERHAVRTAILRAGARQVCFVGKSQAAALGAGLPLGQPVASMICDIGAGTSEIAVLCLGEVAVSETLRVAGDDMSRAVADYLRRRHRLHIGEQMAERIKVELGAAVPLENHTSVEVSGRDAASGMPRRMSVPSNDVHAALADTVRLIVEAVERTLDRCAPELAADLTANGIVLVGGAAQLPGLDRQLGNATGMPVRLADEPNTRVAQGLATCLENLDVWHTIIQDRAAA